MTGRRRADCLPQVILCASLLFYLWLAAQIPYCIDDWSWGSADGIKHYLSADLNSRYVGNLIAMILARSPFLKTVVMAAVFALIPACSAQLALSCIRRFGSQPDATLQPCLAAALLLLGNLLMLTVPLGIWRQAYSWVAGFANFVTAGLVLLLYYGILARAVPFPERQEKAPGAWRLVGSFFFGALGQLVLENVAVHILAFSLLFLLVYRIALKRQAPKHMIVLTLGNLLGTAIMFSSPMYGALLSKGTTLSAYRTLMFDPSSGPISILRTLAYRFFSSFCRSIWGRSWILCCAALLLLLYALLQDSRFRRRPFLPAVQILLLAYFVRTHFAGDIPLPSWSPIHHLTSVVEPLFFFLVALELVMLWRQSPGELLPLLLVWLAVPAIIFPLVAVNSSGPRCFATSDIVYMLFVLLLLCRVWPSFPTRLQRLLPIFLAVLLAAVCVQRTVVYREVGRVKRERDALLRQMQLGLIQEPELPLYPYPEYLWITEPDSPHMGAIFDAFFRIPEGASARFPTREDYAGSGDVEDW